MFIDLKPLSAQATNDTLEYIYKSAARGDRGGGLWDPHDSLLIRRLIELFSQRGLDRLEHVKEQLLAWQKGEHHTPGAAPLPSPGMMQRWSESELALVKLYLEALPPGDWKLKDHMMAVDFVVQRYLPADAVKTEAQWLAARATLMGKVQANLARPVTVAEADKLLEHLPAAGYSLTHQEQAVLDFATERAAEHVQALTDKARHQLKQTVLNTLEPGVTAAGSGGSALETQLFDDFAALNRDWRRIAITEAGECQAQGFIASLKPGTQVRRVEVYETACAFCKKIHGAVMTVVAADAPDKDGQTQVWPGKTNYGRSAAPRKRVGDEWVERGAEELFWIPAGLIHPNCRGHWVVVSEAFEGDDPEFAKVLQAILQGN